MLPRCGETQKEFAFEICARCAIFILVRLDRRVAAIVSTKHPGRETRESTFRTIRVWLRHIKFGKY